MKKEVESGYFVQQNDRGDLLWLDLATKRAVYIPPDKMPDASNRKRLVPLYRQLDSPPVIQVVKPTTWLHCGGCGENYSGQNPCMCDEPQPIAVLPAEQPAE